MRRERSGLCDGMNDVVVFCQSGWTPLHYAAKAGCLEVVSFLVESGASARAECRAGRTPLQYAAQENHEDTVIFLLRPEKNIQRLLDDKKVNIHISLKNTQVCHVRFMYLEVLSQFFINEE